LVELNPEYAEIGRNRAKTVQPQLQMTTGALGA
jgi:hypothetical protein